MRLSGTPSTRAAEATAVCDCATLPHMLTADKPTTDRLTRPQQGSRARGATNRSDPIDPTKLIDPSFHRSQRRLGGAIDVAKI